MQETQEMQVQSLGWEDPLEEIATYSSIIAWKNPMDRGAWWAIVRVTKSWTQWSAGVCVCTHTHILHTNTMGSSPPAPNRYVHIASVQFSFSVVSNSLWPHGLHGVAWPGFPVHHQLPELAQTYVHRVSDAIQPSHPLSSPSPTFNLSQHWGIFQWISSSSGGQSTAASASILPVNIQDWFPLGLTGLISLQSKGLSRVFSNTNSSKASNLQCSAFFIVQLSHPYMTTGKR